MNPLFKKTGSLKPSRSLFDLSHEVKLTCDMGQLIPILADEMVPGDTFKVGNQIVMRFAPLIAPIMHQVDIYVHYFFVPFRILWEDWENFITGGTDGTLTPTLPTMDPAGATIGSLWDYLGFPPDITLPSTQRPLAFPFYAYNMIYNEYYRDETLQTELALTNLALKNRSWEKDYFTSALPWQQRGTPVALPISGLTNADWDSASFVAADYVGGVAPKYNNTSAVDPRAYLVNTGSAANMERQLNANEVDLSSATTFDVSDLRLAFQIQKFLERNARAGARYKEFIQSHFGMNIRDDRIQRPEYIGGSKSRVIISEVLQTSSTDATSPQGSMAGHGITADQTFVGSFTAPEFGIIMGIMSVMPKPAYQQGINRQWLRRTKYDYYFPEFANLSEQAITRQEIFCSAVSGENDAIFGYQGRYDEMRYKPSRVAGLMRTDFSYWHMGRIFTIRPLLNDEFITCTPTKRIYAVPSEPGLVVNIGNLVKAIRPMPYMSNPGLIDHN